MFKLGADDCPSGEAQTRHRAHSSSDGVSVPHHLDPRFAKKRCHRDHDDRRSREREFPGHSFCVTSALFVTHENGLEVGWELVKTTALGFRDFLGAQEQN